MHIVGTRNSHFLCRIDSYTIDCVDPAKSLSFHNNYDPYTSLFIAKFSRLCVRGAIGLLSIPLETHDIVLKYEIDTRAPNSTALYTTGLDVFSG